MENKREQTVVVYEMYPSIQGESSWAGIPCYFIRLTGCPLRCRWCDTEYAFSGGQPMSIPEVVSSAVDSAIDLVQVTGGEPLAQLHCPTLCQTLVDSGKTVLIETAGAHPIDVLPPEVIRIMDLKCPGSGEMDRNLWSNIDHLNQRDEVKFVIADRNDFEWARDVVREHNLSDRVRSVLFSPIFDELEPRNLVEWILEEKLQVRFQLQLHKFVWEPTHTGV